MGNNPSNDLMGLRVTKIMEKSPAEETDLEPYVDFIVDVRERPAKFSLENDFYKLVIEHENKTLHFRVYNILTRSDREVAFKPRRDWEGADFLLGFKVRHESATKAQENIYRITGLKNPKLFDRIAVNSEFFLAFAEFVFADLDELREKLALFRKCEVALYSLESNSVRTLELDCGHGQGLGFEIASGYLHDLGLIYASNQRARLAPRPSTDKYADFRDSEKTGLSSDSAGGSLSGKVHEMQSLKNTGISSPKNLPVKSEERKVSGNYIIEEKPDEKREEEKKVEEKKDEEKKDEQADSLMKEIEIEMN